MITEEGAYVLQPRNGDYNKLSSLIKNIFELNKIKDENAKIAIQNGTEITGLALYTYLYLEKINYNVISYDNAPSDDYQKTIIYDLTDGEKELTLEKLENDLDAYIAKDVPEYILQEYNLNATTTPSSLNNQPDIIIILGQDHANEFKIPEPKIETSTSTDEVIEEILED
jgi:hypothetical protein